MSPYSDSPNSPPQCPTCGILRTVRIKRSGLLQRLVLHRFGMFPWECTGCRKVFMFESRGKVKRRRRSSNKGVTKLPRSLNGSAMQPCDF